MMERLKLREYKNIHGDTYFWRTYSGKEIDIVEDRDGALFGFEAKWQGGSQSLAPREWHDAYRNASYTVITARQLSWFCHETVSEVLTPSLSFSL